MQQLVTVATERHGDEGCLHVSVATLTEALFSFRVTWYSSPFLVEGGLKLLYVDGLRWHTKTARRAEEQNTVGYSRGDPAPIILMDEGSEEISPEEIENLYEVVRYGKRSWPMSIAKTAIERWLEDRQHLIGIDYFAKESSSSISEDSSSSV